LDRRLSEHNNGTYGGYKSKRLPVVLVWSEHFLNITDAIAVERQIKGWSRTKKEALIRGDYELLRVLAKRSG
jgi:putative endonuclease